MIGDLKKNPLYQRAMAEVKKQHRPIVPNFNPDIAQSVDEWKYKSGFQDGFDFLFALMTGDNNGRGSNADD